MDGPPMEEPPLISSPWPSGSSSITLASRRSEWWKPAPQLLGDAAGLGQGARAARAAEPWGQNPGSSSCPVPPVAQDAWGVGASTSGATGCPDLRKAGHHSPAGCSGLQLLASNES